MRSISFSVLAAFAIHSIIALGAPAPERRQENSYCAQISSIIAGASGPARFPAAVAYGCLSELPFDSNRSVGLLDEIRKYVQWQSDLAELKNPPDGSQPVDILGGLDSIESKAKSNSYNGQLDFDNELVTLIASANDGHFNVWPCTTSIFGFQYSGELVSVADSATSQPKIYLARDIINDIPTSPLATINGTDAVDFLTNFSKLYYFQDVDSRYNALFASLGRPANQTAGFFRYHGGSYQGNDLSYTLANGTEGTFSAVAYVAGSAPFNHKSGADVFSASCLPPSTATTAPVESFSAVPTSLLTDTVDPTETPAAPTDPGSAATSAALRPRQDATSASIMPTATVDLPSYPSAVVRDPYNVLDGYYLNDSRSDTAVLRIPTFENNGPGFPDLQAETADGLVPATADFFKKAKADGKTKLVIDLTSNPGGNPWAAMALFRVLFPTIDLQLTSRYRDHPLIRLGMEALNDAAAENLPVDWRFVWYFAWQYIESPSDGPTGWTSYQNLTGPADANLTTAQSWGPFHQLNYGIPGYMGVPNPFQDPPFAAENILLIGDGNCASSCSVFVQLMMGLANVTNTLAFGGRPNSDPMPFVGGVRGSESLSFDTLSTTIDAVGAYVVNRTQQGRPVLSQDQLTQALDLRPLPVKELPLQFGGGHINFRNSYYPNSDLCLQFDHQAAGCRLFYTAENIRWPASTWNDAADAMWGNSSKGCKAPANNVTSSASSSLNGNPSGTSSGSGTAASSSNDAGAMALSGFLALVAAVAAAVALV